MRRKEARRQLPLSDPARQLPCPRPPGHVPQGSVSRSWFTRHLPAPAVGGDPPWDMAREAASLCTEGGRIKALNFEMMTTCRLRIKMGRRWKIRSYFNCPEEIIPKITSHDQSHELCFSVVFLYNHSHLLITKHVYRKSWVETARRLGGVFNGQLLFASDRCPSPTFW